MTQFRSRDEFSRQVEDLAEDIAIGSSGTLFTRKDLASRHIEKAEARGAAEERRKSFLQKLADASERLESRPDLQAWQESQSEFFDAQILEIVTEYAAWRDRKDAEAQEPAYFIDHRSSSGSPPFAVKQLDQCAFPELAEAVYTRPDNVAALEARVKDLEAEKKQAFNQGYLIACCNVANMHNEPSIACDVLAECGLTEDDVMEADLSEYDANALSEIRKARGNRDPICAALTREGGV